MANDPRTRPLGGIKLHALIVKHGSHLKPQPRLPRMQHPTMQAARYFNRLRKGPIGDLATMTEKAVPRLKVAAERARNERGIKADAQEEEDLEAILDELRDQYAEKWTRDEFAKTVNPLVSDVDRFHAAQLNKVLYPVIGIDVVGGEPGLQPLFEAAIKENVSLIKSVGENYFGEIEKILIRETADGVRWEDMADQLQERYGIAERHANLIARDQAGKLFGDLNRIRQTDLGINGYVWRTMEDNRVREEHQLRDGDEFQWEKPPEDGNPGEPIQCRCYGEPDLKPIMASIRGEDQG